MTDRKKWIITTSDDRPVRDVAEDLANAGLDESQVLEEINCIMGFADDGSVAKLRDVPGVVDVSLDSVVDIGPPDSESTW